MADEEAPSFSLGLDFDLDPLPQSYSRQDPGPSYDFAPAQLSSEKAASCSIQEENRNGDYFETPTTDFCHQVSEPDRPLKRLRRGPTSGPALPKKVFFDVDDDIEEFSSQEDQLQDRDPHHTYSVCSSSKLSLQSQGVLSSQKPQETKARKMYEVQSDKASANTVSAVNKATLYQSTVSPLRKFQLVDSDSDGSMKEDLNYAVNQEFSPVNGEQSNLRHIPTPAFDEVLEEYFQSAKHNNFFQNHVEDCNQASSLDENNFWQCDLGPLPPAHQYYFHEDLRIQKLVRSRLPNFFPLGAETNLGHKQQNPCGIDYMSQFGHREASKQVKQKEVKQPSTSRSQKGVRKAKVQELPEGSQSWVNPRSCDIPKDAGKRRVQAVSKSGGHWYTANGRRVYVAKNGQELTGKLAYVQYSKENGAGFKKSKKKTSTKTKAAGRKK